MIGYVIAGLLLLILAIKSFQWQKKEAELKKLKEASRKAKLQSYQSEQAQRAQQIAFARQQLKESIDLIHRKNLFLQSLHERLLYLKDLPDKKNRQILKKIQAMIQKEMDAKSEWENFLHTFESTNPDFCADVKRKYPDLSFNDWRIMVLSLRDLSTREISNLLTISPDGVKKARYRLRKKLGIDVDHSFEDFLKSNNYRWNIKI